MKVIVKDISQWKNEFDVSSEETIFDLKQKIICIKNLVNHSVTLIFKGKQLSDEETLKSYNIEDNSVVIMFATPIKPKLPEQNKNIENKDQSTNKQQTSSPINTLPPDFGQNVEKLTAMGFEESVVIKALQVSFGDAERAVEYLMNGTSPHVIQENLTNQMDLIDESPYSTLQTPSNIDLLSPMNDEIKYQFHEIINEIRENPGKLESFLISFGRANPNLLKTINENQEAFLHMLNTFPANYLDSQTESINERTKPETVQVSVTLQEKEAIQRLCDLGFDIGTATEAYLACDKNEEMAANFLFDP